LYYTMVSLLSWEAPAVEAMFGKTLLISAGLALGTVSVSLVTTAVFRLLAKRRLQ